MNIRRSEAAALYQNAMELYGSFNCRLVEAIELWQAALQIDPDCVEAKMRLGYALEEQRTVFDELRELEEKLCVSPDDAAAYYRTAYLMFILGRDDEARAAWQKVIEVNNGTWAKSARKMLHKRLGDAA